MFIVMKEVQINGKLRRRVLTKQNEFVDQMFIGDRESLTGPHNPQVWLSEYGARKNADRRPGSVVGELSMIQS